MAECAERGVAAAASGRLITRKRTGCLTCRKRHLRCDERRPQCTRCVNGRWQCVYKEIDLPLRERRILSKTMLPGQQVPWAPDVDTGGSSWKLVIGPPLDPFDTLPLHMPYRSRELFSYFHRVGDYLNLEYTDKRDDSVAFAALDPHALRSTMLIAALHHCWHTKRLDAYRSTFLFHKVESLQVINRWLQEDALRNDPRIVTQGLKTICTLGLTEACLGDIYAAEIHFRGVRAFLDLQEQQNADIYTTTDIECELVNRFLILTYFFECSLKERLQNVIVSKGKHNKQPQDTSADDALNHIHTWHKSEPSRLEITLGSLRLIPHFFKTAQIAPQPGSIDATPMLTFLRGITRKLDNIPVDPVGEEKDGVFQEGGPTKLLRTMIDAHVVSTSGHYTASFSMQGGQAIEKLPSGWCGAAGVGGIYLNSVINFSNSGQPTEMKLLRRILLLIKRDLDRSRVAAGRGAPRKTMRDFWFWQSFVALLGLVKSQRDVTKVSVGEDMASLQSYFESRVQAWSRDAGVTDWIVAKQTLISYAWPAEMCSHEESVVKSLWEISTV
ncbi:hypothetical protein BX600DRAFT_503018 [Xylariales sp. PMI_506]|nr:hypothetical protein BX600DRAFT_503018 [Xylariales sp. PMI_506]